MAKCEWRAVSHHHPLPEGVAAEDPEEERCRTHRDNQVHRTQREAAERVIGGPQRGANTGRHNTRPIQGECRAENFGRAHACTRFLRAGNNVVKTVVADVPRPCANRDYGRVCYEPRSLPLTAEMPDSTGTSARK